MLESRGLTRKVEITCIVIALIIWIAALVFGYQTTLGSKSYSHNKRTQQTTVRTSIQFYAYPEDEYSDSDAPSALSQTRGDFTH